MRGPLVVIGDLLLDVDLVGTASRLSPDAPVPVVEELAEHPRPGGAALAAVLAATGGGGTGDAGAREVVLVGPVADDADGRTLRRLLRRLEPGVRLLPLPLDVTPVKRRVRVGGQSVLRLDRGGACARIGMVPEDLTGLLDGAGGVLVSDYGRGTAAHPAIRAALTRRLGRRPAPPVVWDPHPRGPGPVPGVRLATPNEDEAVRAAVRGGSSNPPPAAGRLAWVTRHAERLRARWECAAVAVTLGDRGALLAQGGGAPVVVPARPFRGGDPCGAGDRFAAAALTALADGALPSEAVVAAVRAASDFVAAGGASALGDVPAGPVGGMACHPGYEATGGDATATGGDARGVLDRVRAAGGTVVATGGCFDLLHAGHVATLQAARALGDYLVVLLNSDDSVRRLKGPGRPVVPQQDRAAVLRALGCVDEVVLFDEDTPERALDRLRPHVWVKGGDYSACDLPEADLLRGWGGQVVLLPYLGGRSTTAMLSRAGSARATTNPSPVTRSTEEER